MALRNTLRPERDLVLIQATSPQTDSGRLQVFSGLSPVCRSVFGSKPSREKHEPTPNNWTSRLAANAGTKVYPTYLLSFTVTTCSLHLACPFGEEGKREGRSDSRFVKGPLLLRGLKHPLRPETHRVKRTFLVTGPTWRLAAPRPGRLRFHPRTHGTKDKKSYNISHIIHLELIPFQINIMLLLLTSQTISQ